ncbi:MAG TPA: hypothetical protein VEY12_07610 [Thermoplasmata archaeon]|nr:hypothetical protein [Thermoplasmata archaeon]
MCDEYDDERMRAFWRQLAVLEERGSLDEASEESPVAKPLGELVEPKRAKPRALAR